MLYMHMVWRAWMRHLDFRWMSLIRSPPGPTISFILLAGISSVASGSSSLSDSMARMASSFGILPSCAQRQRGPLFFHNAVPPPQALVKRAQTSAWPPVFGSALLRAAEARFPFSFSTLQGQHVKRMLSAHKSSLCYTHMQLAQRGPQRVQLNIGRMYCTRTSATDETSMVLTSKVSCSGTLGLHTLAALRRLAPCLCARFSAVSG